MTRRSLRSHEKALWDKVKQSVTPRRPDTSAVALTTCPGALEGKVPKVQPPSPAPKPNGPMLEPKAPFAAAYRPPTSKPSQRGISDLDRKTRRKLARGIAEIDGRIDLHGMTQAEAHSALRRFVENAFFARHKVVLVITGKGSGGEGRGILRRQVPHWLAQRDLADLVAEVGSAHQAHGGDGALYIRLRTKGKRR